MGKLHGCYFWMLQPLARLWLDVETLWRNSQWLGTPLLANRSGNFARSFYTSFWNCSWYGVIFTNLFVTWASYKYLSHVLHFLGLNVMIFYCNSIFHYSKAGINSDAGEWDSFFLHRSSLSLGDCLSYMTIGFWPEKFDQYHKITEK